MKLLYIVLLTIVVGAILVSSFMASMKYDLNETDFGDSWPLTIPAVDVECVDGRVIAKYEGKTYAVNGMARQVAEENQWLDITQIWKEDPTQEGMMVNIGPVLSFGLDKCK